jgi:Uma2 family endonuclease
MEEASEFRHELLNGVVVAMAGTSFRHNLIHANLMFGIRTGLNSGCKVVGPEQRVEVGHSDGYVYPDLLVVCGEPKFGPRDRNAITNPTVIIEILSPSTEARDRSEKLRGYQDLESVAEIVLVSQDSPMIETYVRAMPEHWAYRRRSGLEAVARFESVGVSVPFADVYRDVSFGPAALDEVGLIT